MSRIARRCIVLMCLLVPWPVQGHGSVTPEDDLCLIKIGYLRAHFKIYQPALRGHDDFCEDVPQEGDAVFIMEYEHPGLAEAAIDFRIIRNTTGRGIFTSLEDVMRIGDLEPVTVFHHPAAVQADVFMVQHRFDDEGEFVGIVNAELPDNGRVYTAVFPFQVGFTGFGYWPLIAIVAIALQLNYLWMNGWFERLRRRRLRNRLQVIPGNPRG